MKQANSRRRFIQGALTLALLSALPTRLLARMTQAFEARNAQSVMKELFGDQPVVESDEVIFDIPEIAANGAAVPVTISTSAPDVEAIYIIIDTNPNPLSSIFELGPASPAEISTRVKMGTTSLTRAIVKTSSRILMKSKEVKVTIGGCGG